MKIGIETGDNLLFHLEKDDEGDVNVVDSDGMMVITLSVHEETGKVYLVTRDDLDRVHYSINEKKGHTDIEVIS